MKFIKRFLGSLFILLFIINFLPSYEIQAEENTPVWKVAWIVVPETVVHIGDEERTYILSDEKKTEYIDSSGFFEKFIEESTNYAVDIQIDMIEINTVPEFNSLTTDKISINPRLSQEIIDEYNIDEYDTWLVGWSLDENRLYHDENPGGATFDENEIGLLLENSVLDNLADGIWGVCVHEFLHTTEFWFRNKLNFKLPYDIEEWALHHAIYYGYDVQDMPYEEASQLQLKWYSDWLSKKVRDPLYPSEGHTEEYLGIPTEAWHQSPTHITVTFQPNNGEATVSDIVKTGYVIERPENPTPPIPENEDEEKVFRGWYYDEELTMNAFFPHYVVGDVTFYARWVNPGEGYIVPSDNSEAYIDLQTETIVLPSGFNIAAYSVNGGGSWKKGRIMSEKIPGMFNKILDLVITDNYDSKAKKPADNAKIITFNTVEKRPKANILKLKPNYAVLEDPTGVTAGKWVLAEKGSDTAIIDGYQIVRFPNGKLPKPPQKINWEDMPAGIEILPYGSEKQTYFVRSSPITENGQYIPASKPFKIKPAVQTKAPKVKADYKKEIIKLKRGDMIFAGTVEQLGNPYILCDSPNASLTDMTLLYITAPKGTSVSISDYLSTTANTVIIWKAGTDKKTPSMKQIYTLAPRAELKETMLKGSKGKITFPKTHETFNGNKWGKPRISSEDIFSIRLKPTAKGTGVKDSGKAASATGSFKVSWGVYDSAKGKEGALNAVISP
ncbi:MAG: InlB B-repeat-containing protein [Fusobacteriales bacterium]|nr:InlB B-repeat-containing protein [Fusobacteriales bacterium]